MSVFGFQDVWDGAYEIPLSDGQLIRVPTIPGYTVLKLKAWADRSAVGEYKDGTDLATAMSWYRESADVDERLWDDEFEHLEAAEHSVPDAAVRLLATDARAVLSRSRQEELQQVWREVDDAVLAANLENSLLPAWPKRGDNRLMDYARAVRAALEVPNE